MKKTAILYDRDHTKHPFIQLLASSLANDKIELRIYSSVSVNTFDYLSVDCFSFDARKRNWERSLETKKRLRHIKSKYCVKNSLYSRFVALLLKLSYNLYSRFSVFKRDRIDTYIPYFRSAVKILFDDISIYIACRPQVLPLLLFRSLFKETKIIYYPFELYGEQMSKPNNLLLQIEKYAINRKIKLLVTQNECRLDFYKIQKGFCGNGVVVHNYKSNDILIENRDLRSYLNLPKSSRLIVYEGYFIDGRCLDVLVQSLSYLPNDVYLIMIGESKGGWHERNKDLIDLYIESGKLKIIPMVDHTMLYGYVSDCDVGVIIYENSCLNNFYCEPGKLSDYINCGIPFIVPTFPSVSTIVENYKIGTLFKNFTPQDIAISIAETLNLSLDPEYKSHIHSVSNELNWNNEYQKLRTEMRTI